MEKKLPPAKPPAPPKSVVLVGKGPPQAKGDGVANPPNAKVALHGSGPPPGKAALPKPGPPGAVGPPKPALSGPAIPPKEPDGPGASPSTPKPHLASKLSEPVVKDELPKPKPLGPPAGAPKPPLAATGPPAPLKSPLAKQIGPPSNGEPDPSSTKPTAPAAPNVLAAVTKSALAGPAKGSPANGAPTAPGGPPARSGGPKESPGQAGSAPPSDAAAPKPWPPNPKAEGGSSSAKVGPPGVGGAGAALGTKAGPSIEAPPGVDEFGRQRGSVGDLAPRSELTHDLMGNNIPVFDNEGNFVAYATGPPPPLSRLDPARRSRRLADRKPQDRDRLKGTPERSGGLNPGALGGVNVPGGIPGFFLSVPPWPAPTPMPMDQIPGWGYYPQFTGSQQYTSPYAAYPPQPMPQGPYQPMFGQPYGHPNTFGDVPHNGTQQGQPQGALWPGYPAQPEAPGASNTATKDPGPRHPSAPVQTEPAAANERRHRRSSSAFPPLDTARARGTVINRGDEEVGQSKWLPVERHLNNIRGGYGEGLRPPPEGYDPPKRPSGRVRNRSSGARDDVYSGFRPYYVRDKKPYVEEVIPRSGDPQEVSAGSPLLPRKSHLLSKPKERKWDRWGTTGLTAPRKRAYQSLSELASCFSNLDPDDQDDVISLLLLCRKLEQQVEKQHVVIDMLEHDLSEAQKVLKFPPEWRTLEGVDLAGMVPSDAPFQATAATPLFIKNASYLPVNVPDEPNANFGVGVQLPGKTSAVPVTQVTPWKATGAAPASPTATSPAAPAAGAGPKKLPVGLKPKAPTLGVKKPVFKKA